MGFSHVEKNHHGLSSLTKMLLNVQNNFQNMGIINNHGIVVSISWESNLGHVIFSGM